MPERRMNKNGVWSTKHVKQDNVTATIPKEPPPSLEAPWENKR